MQRCAIQYKTAIIRVFVLMEIALLVFITSGVYVATSAPSSLLAFALIGKKLGTVSAGLLSLVVLPGIFKRLQWFQSLRVTMMLFRRHIGILMYWTALMHGLTQFGLFSIAYGPLPMNTFVAFGAVATFISLPLLITSNDFSVRLLKKWWNVLHKLVYLVLLFGALHTLTTSFGTGIALLGLVFAEVVSYIYAYHISHSARR